MNPTAATEAQPLKADEPKKQEEKKEFKDIASGITWTSRVTVKVWVEKQKMFLDPVKDVWALRIEHKDAAGNPVIAFRVRGTSINDTPTKNSIITAANGDEYVATENTGTELCPVKLVKKAEPKNP